MKYRKIILAAAFCLCVAAIGFAGCKEETPPPVLPTEEVGISLDKTVLDLDKYETYQLIATVENSFKAPVWSSDNTAVATVSNTGVVSAVSQGSATVKAAVGEVYAECVVSVTPSGAIPVLTVSTVSVHSAVGTTFPVSASIRYGKHEILSASFTWTVQDNSIVMVTPVAGRGNTAEITLLKKGETSVIVSSVIENTTYSEIVEITVTEDYSMEISNAPISDNGYTLDMAVSNLGNGAGYLTEFLPDVKIFLNGEPADDVVETSVSPVNSDVVSIDEDTMKITAKKAGNVVVKFSAVSVAGTPVFAEIKISVLKPSVELSEMLEIDLQEEKSRINSAELSLPEEITGEFETLKIDDENIQASVESGILSFSVGDRNVFPAGKKEAVLSTTLADFYFDMLAVTMYIDDKADLLAMRDVFELNKTGTSEANFTWNGYYVFRNNVDFRDGNGANGEWNTIAGQGYVWESPWQCGFMGTLDGRGYVVRGLTVTGNGFIGRMGIGGVIKNIGFVDAVNACVDAGSGNGGGYITGCSIGTLENILIVGVNRGGVDYGTVNNSSSAMLVQDVAGSLQMTINNCIVYLTEEMHEKNAALGDMFWNMNYEDSRHIYAIGTERILFQDAGVRSEQGGTVVGFKTEEEFVENAPVINGFTDAWNTEVWDTESYAFPVLKGFTQLIEEIESDSREGILTENAVCGMETDLASTLGTMVKSYALKNEVTGVEIIGNAIKLDKSVSSGTAFTVIATTVWGKSYEKQIEASRVDALIVTTPDKQTFYIGESVSLQAEVTPVNEDYTVTVGVKKDGGAETSITEREFSFTDSGDYEFLFTANPKAGGKTLQKSFYVHVLEDGMINDFDTVEQYQSVYQVTNLGEMHTSWENKSVRVEVLKVDDKFGGWQHFILSTERYSDLSQFASISFEVTNPNDFSIDVHFSFKGLSGEKVFTITANGSTVCTVEMSFFTGDFTNVPEMNFIVHGEMIDSSLASVSLYFDNVKLNA